MKSLLHTPGTVSSGGGDVQAQCATPVCSCESCMTGGCPSEPLAPLHMFYLAPFGLYSALFFDTEKIPRPVDRAGIECFASILFFPYISTYEVHWHYHTSDRRQEKIETVNIVSSPSGTRHLDLPRDCVAPTGFNTRLGLAVVFQHSAAAALALTCKRSSVTSQ